MIFPSIVLGYIVGFVPAMYIHELGHVVAALVARRRIYNVNFGTGRKFLSFKCGGTHVDFRCVPIGGYVWCAPGERWGIWSDRLLFAGGAIFNLIFACIIMAVLANVLFIPRGATGVLFGLFSAQIVIAIRTLLPRISTNSLGILERNDGALLKASFTDKSSVVLTRIETFEATVLRSLPAYGDQLVSTDYSRQLVFDLDYERFSGAWPASDNLKALSNLAAKSETSARPVELYRIDRQVTGWLLTNPDKNLAEMDRLTKRGMEIGPDNRNMRQTRASVLVELGEFEQAKELFQSTADQPNSSFEQALVSYFMLRAEIGMGRPSEAALHLKELKIQSEQAEARQDAKALYLKAQGLMPMAPQIELATNY